MINSLKLTRDKMSGRYREFGIKNKSKKGFLAVGIHVVLIYNKFIIVVLIWLVEIYLISIDMWQQVTHCQNA